MTEGRGAERPRRGRRSSRAPIRAMRPFLESRYRILAVALVLSLAGTGVWLVASVFQIRELGGGPVDLSYVATANAVGLLLAVLFGGAVADLIPQQRILLTIELTKSLVAGAIAALALTGTLQIWHLAVVGFVLGVADGFFYPAYSALLPAILPADDLLAANGVEGTLRPTIMQAAGPALAGAVIAAASPALAFVVVAAAQFAGALVLTRLRPTPLRRSEPEPGDEVALAADAPAPPSARSAVGSLLRDIAEGFRYMVRTPWLLATLVFASLLVLVIMGPIEVLLPFAVTDQTGGGAGAFALVLAAFGIGSAIASLVVASLPLPRRYLTVMNLAWGLSCLPLVVVGFTDQLWLIVIAVFIVGAGFSVGQVIWGTLLQRRVPPELLGRISSLDFFVSLLFMPVSMAIAGPIGEWIGFGPAFLIAGLVPAVLAVLVIVLARLPQDELRHPLDVAGDARDGGMTGLGASELLSREPGAPSAS